MNRRVFRLAVLCGQALLLASTAGAVTPPRDGGALPPAFRETPAGKQATTFLPRRAWTQRAARVSAAESLAPNATPALTGTMVVPVLPGYFSGQLQGPVSQAQLQNQLFDSNPSGTIGDYYSEVSYGQFTFDGEVYPWKALANTNAFYAGNCGGGNCASAHVGNMVKELLDANDGTINFGQYDNDGPDGVPNSGDDDGYVDLLCVLHSFRGGECGLPANIISHTWQYTAWPISGDLPYSTNDVAANGGFIKVDDYTVMPAISCESSSPTHTPNDIGVFCHEFGHGLGLPDLYDRDGSTNGIGDWGIMGTGSWNTPATPAHMDAWSRAQLGWVTPVDIGWEPTPVNIGNVEEGGTVYRLPFTNERFRRSSACVLDGSYSLFCGLSSAEANTRNYIAATGGGYGPNWYETIEHPFHYSGTGSVTFGYAYDYETEPGYDFALAIVEVNGTESVIAAYTGTGAGLANLNITPYLAPLSGVGGDFTLKFRVTTDFSFDDADGAYPTTCGALIIDDVTVQGGGINYASGFEALADGWYQDPAENPVTEYWLVENRRRIGYDDNLHGEGLLIWHVEDELLNAPLLQNDGKAGGVRGLALEEADGLLNMSGSNFGNGGDPYPGTSANTAFTSASSPSSNDNTQRPTRIEVTSIGAAAPTMAATLRAGDPGPVASGATPDQFDNSETAAVLDVTGSGIRAGATIVLLFDAPGEGPAATQEVAATSLAWLDPTRARGTFNFYGRPGGTWDVRVTNPDGQSYLLADAVTLNYVVATQLRAAFVDVIGGAVRLRYEIGDREAGETVRLSRSSDQRVWRVIADNLLPLRGDDYEFIDDDVEAGHAYHYLLESVDADGGVRELHRATAALPGRALVLEQNLPNPFNPRTSIRFYLPARVPVRLDVFDIRGALVRRLAQGTFDAGSHLQEWDGTDDNGRPVASGVYVYRLTADRKSLTKKMMLLK